MSLYVLFIAITNVCLGYGLAVLFGQGIDPRQLLKPSEEFGLFDDEFENLDTGGDAEASVSVDGSQAG